MRRRQRHLQWLAAAPAFATLAGQRLAGLQVAAHNHFVRDRPTIVELAAGPRGLAIPQSLWLRADEVIEW